MEYVINGLLILGLGALYFLAIRYLRRKGTCAGCSGCKSHQEAPEARSGHTCSTGCGGCHGHCAHCSHCVRHDAPPQDNMPTESKHHG